MIPGMRVIITAFLLTALAHAQVAKTANRNYQTPSGRESVAKGLTAPDRDHAEKPGQLVREIGISSGMTVADVGTGPGYMLPFLSAAVGADGKVLAEDIFDDFLAKARARAAEGGLHNVRFVKGTEHSPMLAAASVDIILALDSYHHYDYPRDMLRAFRDALKPGGKLAIVEYYKRLGAMGGGDGALTHIRLDDSGVIREVESAGFQLIGEREHIPKSQYICIFHVRSE